MRTHKQLFVGAIIGCLAVVFAGLTPAGAATVSLDWTLQGGFVQGTSTTGTILTSNPALRQGAVEFFNGSATGLGGFLTDTFGIIGWGCTLGNVSAATCANNANGTEGTTNNDPTAANNRSALELATFTSAQNGELTDGAAPGIFGPAVIISSLTHFNRVIDRNSRTLGTVDINSSLDLPEVSDPNIPDNVTTNLGFLETFNGGGCAQTPNPLDSTCDDRFQVLNPESFQDLFFQHNGLQYQIQFGFAPPCNNVVGTEGNIVIFNCSGVLFGIDNTTFQVFAQEGATSEILIFMQLRQIAVPAPGTLVLLGIGLVGAAGARRLTRKRAA
jgi:hypothetical protein